MLHCRKQLRPSAAGSRGEPDTRQSTSSPQYPSLLFALPVIRRWPVLADLLEHHAATLTAALYKDYNALEIWSRSLRSLLCGGRQLLVHDLYRAHLEPLMKKIFSAGDDNSEKGASLQSMQSSLLVTLFCSVSPSSPCIRAGQL